MQEWISNFINSDINNLYENLIIQIDKVIRIKILIINIGFKQFVFITLKRVELELVK